ncbi:LTA synthase family protein [Pusillimonas sp. ANT_WB101]|uniref:LTA synthase family protein n=1 Tax=Pusillimonas sp. ANT_WB101 TaxID=2597356 RepID=UPI0011EDCA25|nr:LTA synthase family protein [Pusillimonas sp. ANT_WB101]KAA0911385.1 sulfatase-like hydrolase/transferase [Pusillimonas sp. ANT_WB101]
MSNTSLLSSLWAPWLLGLALSFALEWVALPRPVHPIIRGWQALLVHVGLWTAFFGLMLLVFQRPWFGAINLLAFLFLLIEIGNIKWVMLREPFIYPDFEYFTDTIKYPRLYLPFFGVRNAVLATLSYGLALAVGLYFEPALNLSAVAWVTRILPEAWQVSWLGRVLQLLVVMVGFVAVGAALLAAAGRAPLPVSFNAGQDQRKLGFLYFLWRYRQEESVRPPVDECAPFRKLLNAKETKEIKASKGAGRDPAAAAVTGVGEGSSTRHLERATVQVVDAANHVANASGGVRMPLGSTDRPDLVMLQCESFFDLRRTFSTAKPELLSAFDTLGGQAQGKGRLHVPAWGANTVRTEYAVISGVDPARLGVHRYNPYRRYARHAVPTIATYLRSLGYKTICVHPYVAEFYRRTLTIPGMGFDVFLGQEAFPDAKRFGPYISDEAVADKIAALLGEARGDDGRQPLFIYAITMENHGPLDWETVADGEQQHYFTQPLPSGCDDVVAYARHIVNADRMMQSVSATLDSLGRPGGMCVFGDHVPIMPAVYASMGEPDGTTDYFYWANQSLRPSVSGRLQGVEQGAELGMGSSVRQRLGQGQGQEQVGDLPAHELSIAFLKGMGVL